MASPAIAANAYAAAARILGNSAGGGADSAGPSFGQVLKEAVGGVLDTGRKSDAQTVAMASGKANVMDVVTAVAETDVAVSTLVAERDEVMQAHEDIMKMSIGRGDAEPGIHNHDREYGFRACAKGVSRNDEKRVGTEMTGAETLDVARDAIWTIVVVSSPLMIVGLVVGVVVSLFQALTQIQEQTLVFVPKILAIFVTLILALPFMADSLHSHMLRISSRIIGG